METIVGRLCNWLVRWLGWWTLLSLTLLLVALVSVAWALAEVIRDLDFGLLLPVTLVGLLLGWGLATAKPLPGWLAGLLILILGVEAMILRVGRLGGTLVEAGRGLANLAWQTWFWPLHGVPPPGSVPLFRVLVELWTDLSTLLVRLSAWGLGPVTGQPSFDPVAASLAWSLALGAVAAWAGWAVRRLKQPLLALAPAGALLATTLAYILDQVGTLLPVLAATLLLIGLIEQQARERRWQAARIDFASSTRVDLALMIIPISMALVVVAGTVPSISVNKIASFVQELFQAESMKDSLGMKWKPAQNNPQDEIRVPGLPRHHLLGSGPELSEQVALVINIDQPPLALSETGADQAGPGYYWRSLTYDGYTGRGWRTGKTKQLSYKAGEPANPTTVPGRRVLRQTVQVVGPERGLLYAAGELVTVDHNYTVDWRAPGDAFATTIKATSYRVDSLVVTASEAQLRSAGYDYPDWVSQRYLYLPRQVPERVLSLARDLTATAPTAYDRARAIETYLRTYPYSLDLPEPPLGRDMVDYFLFDLQQGYCDYYATAMVVLARAAGLPARLAVGYASGTYDAAEAQYVVTEADAHSWAELYFPGYGWIEFEPTAARQVIDRSAEAIPPEIPEPLPALSNPGAMYQERLKQGWWLILPGVAGMLLAGGLAWLVVDGWRLRRLAPVAAVAILYDRLQRHGQRLAVPVWAGNTPYEFAASLTERVNSLAQERRWQAVLAPVDQEIHWLTHLYVRTSYSAHRPGPADQARAIQTWQRLQKRLWLVWVSTFWTKGEQKRG